MGYDVDKYPQEKSKVDEPIIPIFNKLNSSNKSRVRNFAEDLLDKQNSEVNETNTVDIHSKLSAGTGIIDLDPEDKEVVHYEGAIPVHDLAFIVSGQSMEPVFEDGEIIFVKKTHEIRNGQFIAVQINEEAYIKKVYKEDNQLRLVSLNTEYKDIIADEEDDIRIIVRVIL